MELIIKYTSVAGVGFLLFLLARRWASESGFCWRFIVPVKWKIIFLLSFATRILFWLFMYICGIFKYGYSSLLEWKSPPLQGVSSCVFKLLQSTPTGLNPCGVPPLFPFLVKFLAMPLAPHFKGSAVLIGLLISWLSSGVSSVLLFLLVRKFASEKTAWWTALLFSVWPFSHLWSLPNPYALSLALLLGTVLSLQNHRVILAGLWLSFGLLSEIRIVFLLPWLIVESSKALSQRKLSIVSILFPILGLLLLQLSAESYGADWTLYFKNHDPNFDVLSWLMLWTGNPIALLIMQKVIMQKVPQFLFLLLTPIFVIVSARFYPISRAALGLWLMAAGLPYFLKWEIRTGQSLLFFMSAVIVAELSVRLNMKHIVYIGLILLSTVICYGEMSFSELM